MKVDRPSRTALVVARSQCLISGNPRTPHLVDPEAARFAARALVFAGAGWWLRACGSGMGRWLLGKGEGRAISGLALHHALRKRDVESWVRRELDEEGAGAVTILGAGFDSLAWRLHRDYPGVAFRELDHPATQAAKRALLERLGGPGPNLDLRPVDLGDPGEPVRLASVDASRPAVVVIEGVLMYLPPDRVALLLSKVRRCGGSEGVRLLFTFMDGPGFEGQSPWVRRWLRWAGEPFRWWAPPGEVRDLLGGLGFDPGATRIERPDAQDGGEGRAPARGEWLCQAASAAPAVVVSGQRSRP